MDAIRRSRRAANGGPQSTAASAGRGGGTSTSGGSSGEGVGDAGRSAQVGDAGTGDPRGHDAEDRAQRRAERGVDRRAVAGAVRRMVDRGAKESRMGMGQQEMQQPAQEGVDDHGEGDSQGEDLLMDSDQGDSRGRRLAGEAGVDGGAPPGEPACADDAIIISDDEETPEEVGNARPSTEWRFKRRRRETRGEADGRSANGTPSLLHFTTSILAGMCT